MLENRRRRGSQTRFEGEIPGTFQRQEGLLLGISHRNGGFLGLGNDDEQGVVSLHVQPEETVSFSRSGGIDSADPSGDRIQHPRLTLPPLDLD